MTRRILFAGWTNAIVAAALLTLACGSTPSDSSNTPASASTDPRGADSLAVPQVAQAAKTGRRVIFVGLDGADWQLLDDYMARGVMPNLGRLVREGTGGVLETIRPPLSPLIWTTMMTGVSPLDHGILDFVQFDPATGEKEPITSSVRKVPAIWNMATYGGKRAAALGLWATYPAEPVNGVIVSDRLFTFLFKENAPPAGVVFPRDREAWARDALDRAEKGIDESALKAFLPWLTDADYRRYAESTDPYGHPVSALRRILVETRVYDELGRDVQRDHPDLTIVYIQGTDTVGHVFAPFAPPRQPSVSQADYDKYSQVPEKYFRAIDDRLGEYRRLAEASHAVLMLASDHGFFWKEGRPTTLSSNATATAAKWHRDDGMFMLWGPGIPASAAHDKRGSVRQVCATLLALLGLPPGRDVDGDPLPGVEGPAIARADYFPFYRPANAPASRVGQRAVDDDALAKLKSLGYISGSDAAGTGTGARGVTRTPASYNNEGVILRDRGNAARAIEAFERALALDPNLASALWNLSDVLFSRQNDLDRSDDLLVKAFARGLPDGTKYLIGRAIGYQRTGQADRALHLLNVAVQAQPGNADVLLFRGRYRVDAHECAGALEDFRKAEQLAPNDPAVFASEGLARMCLGDQAGAKNAFARSLQLDPNQPNVRDFLKTLGGTP
jgi:tetratricopeptide (TPR) repeat protein